MHLCDRIGQLVNEKIVEGIAHVNNESNQKEGTRVVVDLKRDAVANVVINQLYKFTELQTSMVSITWRWLKAGHVF